MEVVKRKIKINIDKGVQNGHIYKFIKEGDEHYKNIANDLTVKIKIENNENFERKGSDLFYKYKISLLEALTGVKFIINNLNGKHILIYSEPGEVIKPSTIKTIEGIGMPFLISLINMGIYILILKLFFQIRFLIKTVKSSKKYLKR